MSLRVCFIGNSHLAAIKLGLDSLDGGLPGVTPTFFGSPNNGLAHLRLKGRHLVSQNPGVARHLAQLSGGPDHIDLDAYDHFVLVGMHFGLNDVLLPVYIRHRTTDMTWQRVPFLVSDDCFAAALGQGLDNTLGMRLARRIAAVRPGCVTLIPTPLMSEEILAWRPRRPQLLTLQDISTQPPRIQARLLWRHLKASGDIGKVLPLYERALTALGDAVALFRQPPETVVGEAFTAEHLSRDSIRLDLTTAHIDKDYAHMNAAYGAALLTAWHRQLPAT